MGRAKPHTRGDLGSNLAMLQHIFQHVYCQRDYRIIYLEFCYNVYNKYESFICLDLMVKNIEVPIKKYFKC
jgi:hypothetical protein